MQLSAVICKREKISTSVLGAIKMPAILYLQGKLAFFFPSSVKDALVSIAKT